MRDGRARRWGRALTAAVASLALLLTVVAASQWRVQASPSALAGVTAAGSVDADPYATWLSQMNRDGICALLTGCRAASGEGGQWVFSMLVDVPGAGLQTIPVPVTVTKTVPYRSMDLTLQASGVVGTVDAAVRAELTPAGRGTTVRLTIVRATTSGLAETYVPQFIDQFEPVMQAQLATLDDQRTGAGITVALRITSGRKARAAVSVKATSLTSLTPLASGTVRILVGQKVVCVAKLQRSKGACAFTRPPRGTWVRAVVTGEFDNGYRIWNSATARYRP